VIEAALRRGDSAIYLTITNMPTQRETTKRAAPSSEIDSRHIERLLSIDPEGLNLAEKRKTWRKDLQLPLAILAGAIATLVGGGLAIGGIDIVASVFGERSFDHLLVRSVLNGAAVLILLSPLIGLGLSTGPARSALRGLVDWLLEEEIGRARAYVQKVEGDEGLLWRFLEEEVGEIFPESPLGDERWKELAHQSKEGHLGEVNVEDYRRAVCYLQSRWRQRMPSWENDSSGESLGEREDGA